MIYTLGGRDREVSRPPLRNSVDGSHVVITGGAGFVGCNLAARLMSAGRPVVIFDNISRAGVRANVAWLRERFGRGFDLQIADVRDRDAVFASVYGASAVFHLAAQVAVTSSLADPVEDFSINAVGTLNVLEALRAQAESPPLIYTSTNKVYGDLEDLSLKRTNRRYEPVDPCIAIAGIGEGRPLDFHGPYGCSKGTADQYVHDYSRSYDMRTVVFRMSCIYGPHQYGNEDQGWLAHFLISAMRGQPIMIYGDGRQVRDALFVEDLVDALLLAERDIDSISGEVFNLGGGPANTISLIELLERIEELTGERPDVAMHGWRMGDQRYYVSDNAKFGAATGWSPTVDLETGLARMHEWLTRVIESDDVATIGRGPAPARTRAVSNSGFAADRAP
ncbi:MAG TPA: NAD-dependent epimerase/dehydratase family protein [Gemmatimonadaceae bacterium]|nr:NAD-dependent epimerase/dehydratase family protein [Gemmatimonadaceae bacterium]